LVDGRQRRAKVRDSYHVVDYIEPLAGNEAAVGLDTAISEDRNEARRRSRVTGQAAVTSLLSLAQYKGWHSGFLAVAPVYLRGVPLDTVAARERATIGETAAVFRVDHLIDPILGGEGFLNVPGMTISVYANPTADSRYLAFRHGRRAGCRCVGRYSAAICSEHPVRLDAIDSALAAGRPDRPG